MKRNLLVVAILLATFVPLMLITQTLATSAADGKELFVSNKCGTCHSVSSAGIEAKMKGSAAGPDLKGVAGRHSAEWMGKYVRKEENLEGKPHKASFKGTDEELQALIDWLGTQK